MGRSINHRGWIVLESIASEAGDQCVDLFADPAGGFGFEVLRSDPEDGGRWTAVGGFGSARFDDRHAVAAAVRASVPWLRRSQDASDALASWESSTD